VQMEEEEEVSSSTARICSENYFERVSIIISLELIFIIG
jgi:hypothetical protein